MPLPVGHSMMGYVLHETLGGKKVRLQTADKPWATWKTLLLFVFLANLPDLDFLAGFFMGEPHLYHRHFVSHSIGAAAVVGCMVALCFGWRDWRRFAWHVLLFGSVYFSHVFLDAFSHDTARPFGVPMFWPFSKQYIFSPVLLFMSVEKAGSGLNFIKNLFVMHNFGAAVLEFMIFVPVLSIIKLVKNRRRLAQPIYEE